MEHNLFFKLCSNFTVSWDIENLLKKFIEDKVDPEAEKRKHHLPYSDPSGKPHWQLFPTGISFSRNFYQNFSAECLEVAIKLKNLQLDIKNKNLDNTLVKEFSNCNIFPNRISLIRVLPGRNVSPHIDFTRNYSLNIGLRNSNSGITYISYNQDIEFNKYQNSPKLHFTVNDGDAYILDVSKAHSVESLVPKSSSIIRYLITYNLKNV